MQLKLILFLLLISSVSACSSSGVNSQTSVDTKNCNAISYGNKHGNAQSMDEIYKKCMKDKNKLRKQQSDEQIKWGFIEFIVTLFHSVQSRN